MRCIPALLLLCFLFTTDVWAQKPSKVEAKVRECGPGRRIEATLTSGLKVVGKVGAINPDGFTLYGKTKGQTEHELSFTEVRSVKTKWSAGEKWLIGGLIYFAVVGIGAAVEH